VEGQHIITDDFIFTHAGWAEPVEFLHHCFDPARPHVIEVRRFKLAGDAKSIEVTVTVEDPGAFTTPWNAVQRYARFEGSRRNDGRLVESACAESASYGHFDYGNYGETHSAELAPVPKSDRPDF
jgi:hypothetical protein